VTFWCGISLVYTINKGLQQI